MVCHEFKGGIGTSSRMVEVAGHTYTIGALVQANYGARELLRLDGRPIGATVGPDVVALPEDPKVADAGSIIVIIATDAPLLADQCKRLARRATVGLARVGGTGGNGSGDIFLAFSTANRVEAQATVPTTVTTLPAGSMTPLINATAEAVEESIWNALCAAETMTGFRGRTVHAIPHDLLIAMR
jgi:D-aminopeptidase